MVNLGANFYPSFIQMTNQLGMKPEDLLAVMTSESGINPAAGNKGSGASGLIQFMPSVLSNTGFKGDPSDFRQLSGEDQLPYIQKLIEGNMKYNGGPFKSAAQYYVANLWPVALRLPGIKAEDPSTAFLEANPATVTDPKTGKVYSKKYYDIGQRITPQQESQAYKSNPLFHGSTPGAITYGDMMNQVNKNKRSPIYQRALAALKNNTGYQAQPQSEQNAPKKEQSPFGSFVDKYVHPAIESLDQLLTKYLGMISAAPNYLIQIKNADYTDAVEFARVLGSVLDEELKTRSYTYTDGKYNVDLECKKANLVNQKQIEELAEITLEQFKEATNTNPTIKILKDKVSNYQEINVKHAETSYRKFHLKFIGQTK